MARKSKKNNYAWIYAVAGGLALLVVGVVGWFIVGLMNFDKDKAPAKIQTITLVKPPPPPKVEDPPPPEQKIEEEVVEVAEPEQAPEEAADASEAGEELGLDAEGTAGGDNFGLKAKPGGRALIGGGRGRGSLMSRYGWYTSILQKELQTRFKNALDDSGGMPDGKRQALVRIELDSVGNVVDYAIVGSSGDPRMDKVLEDTLSIFKVPERPPTGMPMAMTIKVTSQG